MGFPTHNRLWWWMDGGPARCQGTCKRKLIEGALLEASFRCSGGSASSLSFHFGEAVLPTYLCNEDYFMALCFAGRTKEVVLSGFVRTRVGLRESLVRPSD